MQDLSTGAESRGKRARKNLRKYRFSEVLFDLLLGTNRSFLAFFEVLFGIGKRTWVGKLKWRFRLCDDIWLAIH
jgi:hypothetical protein